MDLVLILLRYLTLTKVLLKLGKELLLVNTITLKFLDFFTNVSFFNNVYKFLLLKIPNVFFTGLFKRSLFNAKCKCNKKVIQFDGRINCA